MIARQGAAASLFVMEHARGAETPVAAGSSLVAPVAPGAPRSPATPGMEAGLCALCLSCTELFMWVVWPRDS